MNPITTPHPSDRTLGDYGLGKLDDASAGTVHDHLEACDECRGRVAALTPDSFLGRVRAAQGAPADGTLSQLQGKVASPPPAETLPPGLADHADYEIRRELGRGGMGVVYLAHNTMMGRDEVLKVIGRHIMERPSVLERFQREIRAVAKLRHPNIVAAHAAFRIDGGLVFAMEYVEGLDLSKLVKAKGPLPVTHAAYFIHQAALGLQHAHERGMVHRDIKPHNLMLTHDGKARVVKILDFGLAKASREGTRDSGLTNEGQMLGTPDFIAPEQIRDAQSADIRADIYSLGCTLYYLLTGRAPFQAALLYDVLQAHFSMDAEPLHLIRPEVPAELAALASKMMAKDPDRRFQTPGAVAQALMPFFKKTSAAPKADLSTPAEIPAPKPKPRAPIPRQAEATTQADGPWADLIDTEPSGPSVQLLPRSRPPGRPDGPGWARPAMAAALALLGVVIAGVFIITIRTKDGVITAENPPPGTTATLKPGGEASLVVGRPEALEPQPAPAPPVASKPAETPKAPKPAKFPDPPVATAAQLAAALNRPIPMPFANPAPLADVLRYVHEASQMPGYAGIPIYVDPMGLLEAEKTMASTIVLDKQGLPLRTTLRLVLSQLGLTYETHEGLLAIGAPPDPGDPPGRPVTDLPSNGAPENRPILEALARPIPIHFARRAPLADVTSYLAEALGPPGTPVPWIYVDPNGLKEAEKTMASTVILELEGIPLRITLNLMLRQIGLGYHVSDGILTITDHEGAQSVKAAAVAPPPDAPAGRPEAAKAPAVVGNKSPVGSRAPAGSGNDAGGGLGIYSGAWSVEGDELVQTWTGGPATLLLGQPDWSRYDLTFDFQAAENGDGAWAAFHYLDNGNNVLASFGVWKNTRHGISKAIEGKVARESIPGRIEPGRWYSARIKVRGPEASCFLDGQPTAHYLDPRLQRGRVGIGGFHASVRFRNIEVRTPEGKPLFVGIPRI